MIFFLIRYHSYNKQKPLQPDLINSLQISVEFYQERLHVIENSRNVKVVHP